MILDDLDLFGAAWLAMLLAGVALAWPGILIVARGQSFLAVAASQTAACGAAGGMALIGLSGGGHLHGDARIHLGALLGGLLGTAFGWRGSSERAAWLFALGSAGSLLLVAHSPYGMHDTLALQSSNVLGAGAPEAIFFGVASVLSVAALVLTPRELRLLATDPGHAALCGLRTTAWCVALGCWIGLLLSLGVSSLGLLYTFGCLVLPTLIARQLFRQLWPLFLAAPLIALGAGILGIGVGHAGDLPPGQTTVGVLVALLPLAFAGGWIRRRSG
jgi:ABC-type Mn2+/Zn2+ transport system permease subunit